VKFSALLCLFFAFALCGCIDLDCDGDSTRPRTSVEIQSMQTREFDASYRIAFAAVVDVFQDLGYVIQSSDFTTGLIIAKSSTSKSVSRTARVPNPFDFSTFDSTFNGKVSFEHGTASVEKFGTVHVEELSNDRVSIRVSFVKSEKEHYYASDSIAGNSLAVEDEAVYLDFFAKIDKSIFIRQNFR
jgi:hypothetical protein